MRLHDLVVAQEAHLASVRTWRSSSLSGTEETIFVLIHEFPTVAEGGSSNNQLLRVGTLGEPPGDGVVDIEVVSRMILSILLVSAIEGGVVPCGVLPPTVVVVVHDVQQVQHFGDLLNLIGLLR